MITFGLFLGFFITTIGIYFSYKQTFYKEKGYTLSQCRALTAH